MNTSLDAFAEKLQNEIDEETRRIFGEIVFQRWKNPLFMGRLDDFNGYGKITGNCGDSIEIFLKLENDRVAQASFLTSGCAPSIVSGSFAAEYAIGKNPEQLFGITGETLLQKLNGLPKENEHCAFLAASVLHEATNNYMLRQNKK